MDFISNYLQGDFNEWRTTLSTMQLRMWDMVNLGPTHIEDKGTTTSPEPINIWEDDKENTIEESEQCSSSFQESSSTNPTGEICTFALVEEESSSSTDESSSNSSTSGTLEVEHTCYMAISDENKVKYLSKSNSISSKSTSNDSNNEEEVTSTSSSSSSNFTPRNKRALHIELRSKFSEIVKEHDLLISSNQLLMSDNSRLTEELKSIDSLTLELNNLKAENERLKEECIASNTREEKLKELLDKYAGSSKAMDTLLSIQKSLGDRTGLGFNSSSSLEPPSIGPVFVKESNPQPENSVVQNHNSTPVDYENNRNRQGLGFKKVALTYQNKSNKAISKNQGGQRKKWKTSRNKGIKYSEIKRSFRKEWVPTGRTFDPNKVDPTPVGTKLLTGRNIHARKFSNPHRRNMGRIPRNDVGRNFHFNSDWKMAKFIPRPGKINLNKAKPSRGHQNYFGSKFSKFDAPKRFYSFPFNYDLEWERRMAQVPHDGFGLPYNPKRTNLRGPRFVWVPETLLY